MNELCVSCECVLAKLQLQMNIYLLRRPFNEMQINKFARSFPLTSSSATFIRAKFIPHKAERREMKRIASISKWNKMLKLHYGAPVPVAGAAEIWLLFGVDKTIS